MEEETRKEMRKFSNEMSGSKSELNDVLSFAAKFLKDQNEYFTKEALLFEKDKQIGQYIMAGTTAMIAAMLSDLCKEWIKR